ncbi:hypothetical protein J2S04_002024 [Alicyclobacillus tengchongensis]|uniref:Uncharacterized protein n=2 Tax=Alicyclobacillus tolerans TaxID=90970 RepID=A0A1M6W982_9BACL|nr:hypothetical protein [Alicyclobacillus tengchongensis]SHK90055.1 hypothetical protein SAMN05443507_12623 [Alicyclobacillus montanus]
MRTSLAGQIFYRHNRLFSHSMGRTGNVGMRLVEVMNPFLWPQVHYTDRLDRQAGG